MELNTLLREEIQVEFEQLKKMNVGTEEYKITVEGLTKLMDRAIEFEKNDTDYVEKVKANEAEMDLKAKQMHDEKVDRIVKNTLTGVSIVGGLVLTVWGSLKSWKFEETGTITNGPGREFMKKIFHMK